MLRGIDVEITIRDNDTGQYLLIPVLPPSIQYQDGAAQANTVQILDLGDVDFPNGVALDSCSWASFFPARYDPSYCATSQLLSPEGYRNKLSGWKDNSTSLQLIIPAAGISKTMYLSTFTWDYGKGHEGDIYYQLSFVELKSIRPKKLTPQGTVPPKGKKEPADRKPAPAKPKPKTYTVKSGDSLSLIAKKLGISSWKTIYEKNKGTIGANPNLIKVGQVFKL